MAIRKKVNDEAEKAAEEAAEKAIKKAISKAVSTDKEHQPKPEPLYGSLTPKRLKKNLPQLFKPGKPGGPGMPKDFITPVLKEVMFEINQETGKTRLYEYVIGLVKWANKGNSTAMQLIYDRIAGKQVIPVEGSMDVREQLSVFAVQSILESLPAEKAIEFARIAAEREKASEKLALEPPKEPLAPPTQHLDAEHGDHDKEHHTSNESNRLEAGSSKPNDTDKGGVVVDAVSHVANTGKGATPDVTPTTPL